MKKLFLVILFMLSTQGSVAAELSASKFSGHKVLVRDTIYDGKTAILVEEPTDLINRDEDKFAILDDILLRSHNNEKR